MRFFVVKGVRRNLVLAILGVLSPALLSPYASINAHAESGGTTINTTICSNSSTITINKPKSDSTVVDPGVIVSGTVSQASQIEVYVDDSFDTVIPLSASQVGFQTTIQLTVGTHTIKLVAVHTCGSNDASSNVVLTYALPPATNGSVGSKTTTQVGGVVVNPGAETAASGNSRDGSLLSIFRSIVIDPIESIGFEIGNWLNIQSDSSTDSSVDSLGVFRAIALAGSALLAVFGLSYGFLNTLLLGAPSTRRALFNEFLQHSVAIRFAGVVLFFVTLLL